MIKLEANEPLRAAYREHNARQLTRSVMWANIIAMVVVPSGAMLDYFLYPDHFIHFLLIRLADAVLLLAFIGLLFVGGKRHQLLKAKVLGVLGVLSITSAISLMIYLTEGAKSPYFAGVNLAIMCWAGLLPWSIVQTVIMCACTLLVYVVACVANPSAADPSFYPFLGFNVSFILIASTICVGLTFVLSRARFEEFSLRHQLDAQNRELQDLDRLKTQFFSNVSHELRTPLTLILGPVETLLTHGEALEPKVHENLLLIHRNTLRLLKLINDLLELTRLDLGGGALRRKPFLVGAYVKGIVDSVRHLGLSKRLRIVVEEGDSQLEAVADPVRIEKALINLLTNALKYTPPGGSVTVRWSGSAQGTVIEVQDTGVGIPPEDLPRIFDRFHQVRSNAANQNQGVGIGLALVKELVEQHGGRIEVESEIEKGATFRIVLPVSAQIDAATEAALVVAAEDVEEPFEKAFRSADRAWRSAEAPADHDLPVVGKGQRVVLVADDEADMRQYLVSLLAQDYRVVQTSGGGGVRDLVAEHEPDLVLLDWMMPGKDGLTVCRELRSDEANRDRKIMLLTARFDEKSKIDALQSGADDFLTKPFSSMEVKTRVSNLLRVAQLQRELRASNEDLLDAIEKLQRTEALLIQSEKMNALGSLSAGLLHEINNPLNYTLTAISFARQLKSRLPDEANEILSDVEEGMGRIRDVVTHLKNFAYPEKAGTGVIFPIEETVRAAWRIVSNELEGVEVTIDLPAELIVQGQKTQFTHLFINFFSNAAKAFAGSSGVRAPRISVSGEIRNEFGEVRFCDNGPGIPPDVIGRIFDPFFTTRDVGAGMGMGLSLCQTVVTSHGGAISARNTPEGGAEFTVQIPISKPVLNPC